MAWLRNVYNPLAVLIPVLEIIFWTAVLVSVLSTLSFDGLLSSLFCKESTEYMLLFSFVRAGFFEELVKSLVIARYLLIAYEESGEDLFVTGVCAGSGFAAFENILYLTRGPLDNSLSTMLIRSASTTPLHIACGLLCALLVGEILSPGSRRSRAVKVLGFVGALILPVLMHGAYDFIVLSMSGLARGVAAIVLFHVLYGSVAVLMMRSSPRESTSAACASHLADSLTEASSEISPV